MDSLHPFGCRADYFVEPSDREKFGKTSDVGILIGYVNGGYEILPVSLLRAYLAGDNTAVFRTKKNRDVSFVDHEFPAKTLMSNTPSLPNLVPVYIPNADVACNMCGRTKTNEMATCRACRGASRRRVPHTLDFCCKKVRCRCSESHEAEPSTQTFDHSIHLVSDDNNDFDGALIVQGGAVEEPEPADQPEVPHYDMAEDDSEDDIQENIDPIFDGVGGGDGPNVDDLADGGSEDLESNSDDEQPNSSPPVSSALQQLLAEAQAFIDQPTPEPLTVPHGATAMNLSLAKHLKDINMEIERRRQVVMKRQIKECFGCVVKVIDKGSELWNSPEAKAALDNEIMKLRDKFGIADFHDPKEWTDVANQGGSYERIGFKLILGIKHYEQDPSQWKWKARGCAAGNYMIDTSGWQTFENRDDLSGKPSDMTAARIAMVQTLANGGVIEQADAQSAYCQAPLLGHPKWLAIPRHLRQLLNIPDHMQNPVCRLRKALYGLVRSGFDWQEHATKELVAKGWSTCWDGEQGVLQKTFRGKRYLLVIYVDDFILGGSRTYIKEIWQELQGLFMMDDPEPLNKFLGVHHEIIDGATTKRGNALKKVTMSQREYWQSILDEYKKVISYPVERELRKVSTPMHVESIKHLLTSKVEGQRAAEAARWVGKLLYLSRMKRPDVHTAVCRLSRLISCWNEYADAVLHRIMEYLDHTSDLGLHFQVEVGVEYQITAFVDADHSGDPATSRSTTGWIIMMDNDLDESTKCLVSWLSKRQQATAWPSGEAEVVALSECSRPAIRTQLLTHGISGGNVAEGESLKSMRIMCDANAAILAVRKGYSSMSYAEKTQRVRIGALKEELADAKDVQLEKVDSLENTADAMTKPLEYELFSKHRAAMQVRPIERG